MHNIELKMYMKRKRVTQWMLADYFGVHEITICRRLRHELTDEDRAHMFAAVDAIAGKEV